MAFALQWTKVSTMWLLNQILQLLFVWWNVIPIDTSLLHPYPPLIKKISQFQNMDWTIAFHHTLKKAMSVQIGMPKRALHVVLLNLVMF
jgi:hypothetical protein